MENNNDIIKVFDENSNKYNKSIIDNRIFGLVRNTLLDDSPCEQDEITLLDKKMLSKSLMQIKIKMRHMNSCKEYKKLTKKLEQLEQLVKSYIKLNKVCDNPNYDEMVELRKLHSISNLKIKYLLIELRTAVGLDLDSIAECDIIEYCLAIVYDINNGKYKTLTIDEHIDEENKTLSHTKVKLK